MRHTRRAGPIGAFLALWTVAVAAGWSAGLSPAEPVAILLVVGFGFSALASWSARRAGPATERPAGTPAQLIVLAGLLLAVTAYLTWGRGLLGVVLLSGEEGTAAALAADLVEKLLVFVAVPVAVFRGAFGYRLADLGVPRLSKLLGDGRWLPVLVVGGAFVGFQALAGQGARPVLQGQFGVGTLAIALPLTLAWLVLEVGLVEETFFRALLQDRIAAATRNGWVGILGAALIFGIAHAPGLVLRGGGTTALGPTPTAMAATAYSVSVIAVAGVFLGVLWERTRSLPVVVLVHALGDLLQTVPEVVRALGLR